MSKYNRPASLLMLVVCILSCKSKPADTSDETLADTGVDRFIGYYADNGYANRNEGADWVGLIIRKGDDSAYHISVRSRADRKKTTCTFDAEAGTLTQNTLRAIVNGIGILFIVNDSSIQVQPERAEEADRLNYFCSGGATIIGTYLKQKDNLDPTQVDHRIFAKFLSLQNIFFDIESRQRDSGVYLTVKPYGLTKDTGSFHIRLNNRFIVNAETEDLNSDGYPELLIYTRSSGADKKGDVIGLSVNKGKSMSMIAFPGITEDTVAAEGYKGSDEFAIVETKLQRRFFVYNGEPISRRKFITYKMVQGEAGYRFIIDQIREE